MAKKDYLKPMLNVVVLEVEEILSKSIENINQDGFIEDTLIGDKTWDGLNE